MRTETNFIRTYKGKNFWPLDPRAEELDIEDIAHALSQQCRWTGHTKYHYSVAQHCCYVSDILPTRVLKLEGLLHDASEAYLSDLARPIKMSPGLGEVYREVEGRLEKVIAEKYGLLYPMSPEVKAADSQLLMEEKEVLMKGKWREYYADGEKAALVKIERWIPERAEEEFLTRFHLLTSPETFTTGEYAKSRGLSRSGALARLGKLEEKGILERVKVRQNQGGIVRPNVLGWKFLSSEGSSGRAGSRSESEQEVVAQGYSTGGSGS